MGSKVYILWPDEVSSWSNSYHPMVAVVKIPRILFSHPLHDPCVSCKQSFYYIYCRHGECCLLLRLVPYSNSTFVSLYYLVTNCFLLSIQFPFLILNERSVMKDKEEEEIKCLFWGCWMEKCPFKEISKVF